MAKKIFDKKDNFRIQLSYLFQQNKNIMEANNLRTDLKDMEDVFKECDEDFENELLNPNFEYNIATELYNDPKFRIPYNEVFNKGIDDMIQRDYKSLGQGCEGGRRFGGIIMLILGILSLPLFMVIFPIVLIVYGVKNIKEANRCTLNKRSKSLQKYGIQFTDSTKPADIKRQFLEHMNMIKSLDDKSGYFKLFEREITSFAKFVYANYTFDDLIELPYAKAKKKEIKEVLSNLKKALKDLLEIGKTLSKKYEAGLKKLDKELTDRALGNFYFVGNSVILYEDQDVDNLEDLFYMLDNNLGFVHSSTKYRNDADVELLKESFAYDTLEELTERLYEDGYIINSVDDEEVYIANPENDITKKDKDLLDLFLELLDATNSINNFKKIFEEE